MFKPIILLACVVGFLYVLLKNVFYIHTKRKKARRVQQAVNIHYSTSKADLLRFGYRYARHYLRTHQKRAAVLLFGFVAATTIVTSSVLWIETAPYVVLEKGLANQAFPLIVRPESASVPERIYSVERQLRQEPLVEMSKIVRQSVGLYGLEDKNESFEWYTQDYLEGRVDYYIGQLDELFIVPEDYLPYVKDEFYVKGTLLVSRMEVVISQRLAIRIGQRLNRTLEVGSSINVTVGQRFANTLGGQVQLKHWEPYLLRNMRIAGIFVRKPLDPLIGDTYSEDTLGDAIFISEKTLPREAIDKITKNGNLVTIRLFVRLSRMELAARGIGNLRMTIKDFKAQVEERNNWNVIIDSNTASLYALVGMFTVSRLLVSFLLLPAFVAAFLFIIFVSRLLFQDRREELALLGARGASVFQIFYGALMEMVLLASLGSILGIILSVGTVSLIAGTKAFLEVNFGWGLIWDILILMLFRPWLWILPPLICSAVLVFSVSYQINSYLQREDGVTRVASKRFRTWFVENSLDVVGLVGGYILLVGATLLGIIDSIAADASWLAALLLLILGLWIGFSLISTKVQTALSRPATRLLKPLLGSQSMFVLRSFQHRKSQILALGTIFVLAGSICFFSLSYQTTVQTHTEKVVTFTVGADLRLRVDGLNVTDLTTRLANIPAIDKATPIFESWGFIGERRIAVIGLVPELYAPIIADKISDPTIQYQWKNTLERLGNQSRQRGIIINTLIAQNYAVDIGEPFHLKIRQEYQRTFNIVGIFAAAPGFGLLSEDPQTYAGNNYGTVFLSAGSDVFTNQTVTLCLCKLKPETDVEALIHHLYAEIPEITQIQTLNVDSANVGFLSLTGTAGILTFNFIMAICTFFLTLVLFFGHVVDQRRIEYAIMRVCGAKKRDVYKVISGEGLLVIGMSFGLSVILGLTFAWIFAKISLQYLYFHSVLPLTFEFSGTYLVPLSLVLLCAILFGTILPAHRAQRQHITNILKNL